MTKDQSGVQNVVKNLIGVIKMHDKNEDAAQAEFCRQWSEQHLKKKIRRIQSMLFSNIKVCLKTAWTEFKAIIKGR